MQAKPSLILILMLTMLVQAACAPSANACPTVTSDTKLLTNTQDGYCLLYPAEHAADRPGWVVINPNPSLLDAPGEAWVNISVQDAAGRTIAQIADEMLTTADPAFNLTLVEIEVDGSPAIVVDGLPGIDSNRIVMMIRNDRLYSLTFMPWYPSSAGTGQITPLEQLYETIIQSIHFLPPA